MMMGFTSSTFHLDWQTITKCLCKGVQKYFNKLISLKLSRDGCAAHLFQYAFLAQLLNH